jgi:hypothetical protein
LFKNHNCKKYLKRLAKNLVTFLKNFMNTITSYFASARPIFSGENSPKIPVSARKSPGRAVRAFKRGRSLTEISPAIYSPGSNPLQ